MVEEGRRKPFKWTARKVRRLRRLLALRARMRKKQAQVARLRKKLRVKSIAKRFGCSAFSVHDAIERYRDRA